MLTSVKHWPIIQNMATETLYTTLDMVRIAGVTPRMLQWWDGSGLVSPDRDGNKRLYTSQQAVLVMAIKALRLKGVPLREITAAIPGIVRDLKKTNLDRPEGRNALLAVGAAGHGGVYKHASCLTETMTDQLEQPCWAVDLAELWARLQEHSNVGGEE